MLLADKFPGKTVLKVAKADKIKLIHQIIFTTDKNWQNRENVDEFTSFQFQIDDDVFTVKLCDITDNFSKLDLFSIVNLLTIGIDEECRLLIALTDLEAFSQHVSKSFGFRKITR